MDKLNKTSYYINLKHSKKCFLEDTQNKMSGKQRSSTQVDSKQKKRNKQLNQQIQKSKIKYLQIYYNEEKVLDIQIEGQKTVKDLNKVIKVKLKERFYNFMGIQSYEHLQVLDAALLDKKYSLVKLKPKEKFRILLQGEVQDLYQPTINDFIFQKCLGQGASSIVYLVRHNQNCKLYALKQINKSYIDGFKKMESLLLERKILIDIANNSPFYSRVYAAFQSKDHLNFLLKYYPGGQFFYHLQNKRLKQKQFKLYFCQILLAIEHLHQNKVIFRDLKPQNIMIDLKGHAILSDFGLCKQNIKQEELCGTFCGSSQYMPPEMKNQTGYNYHADFYTLGALLYEMATSLPPFYNNKPLEFHKQLSQQVKQLMLELLQPDMKKRLCNFRDLKNHKWLKDINWQKLKNKQYKMPINLDLYKSYIHEEFVKNEIPKQTKQSLFDKLFGFFYFLSQNDNGISKCYLEKNNSHKQSKILGHCANKVKSKSKSHTKQKSKIKIVKNSIQSSPITHNKQHQTLINKQKTDNNSKDNKHKQNILRTPRKVGSVYEKRVNIQKVNIKQSNMYKNRMMQNAEIQKSQRQKKRNEKILKSKNDKDIGELKSIKSLQLLKKVKSKRKQSRSLSKEEKKVDKKRDKSSNKYIKEQKVMKQIQQKRVNIYNTHLAGNSGQQHKRKDMKDEGQKEEMQRKGTGIEMHNTHNRHNMHDTHNTYNIHEHEKIKTVIKSQSKDHHKIASLNKHKW